ncbi:MAG: hypothetical protein ACRYF3_04145 [Janthinobacterium lividum]
MPSPRGLLSRRPPRYVPRHSTRQAAPLWALPTEHTEGEGAHGLLKSVLSALDSIDAPAGAGQATPSGTANDRVDVTIDLETGRVEHRS